MRCFVTFSRCLNCAEMLPVFKWYAHTLTTCLVYRNNSLERPCMEHLQIVVDGCTDEKPCGHALMASCPPSAVPDPSLPWAPVTAVNPNPVFKLEEDDDDLNMIDYLGKDGTLDLMGNTIEQKTWDIPPIDLSNLMNLSKGLDLKSLSEITPVHAWAIIRNDERFPELGRKEIKELAGLLVKKVRCYGSVFHYS